MYIINITKAPEISAYSIFLCVSESCLTLYNPWTLAHKAPLSMEFSRQESWSELLFPPPGDIPDPEIEPVSPELQEDSFWLSCPTLSPSITLPFIFFS